jgi:saccharopine dehydrogenase-like NADP-dependent oxidoreductase
MVQYLLNQPDFEIWVATRTVTKAQETIGRHPRGKAIPLLVDDEEALDRLVAQTDLVVSLLPYTYHVKVAGHCLKHRRPLVTTSYVSDAMRALDPDARAAGLLFLNEIGLDPGIDHMSAMRITHSVQRAGGTVTAFESYCGGLPAPEANDNPLGYKFSWSPKGVVMAGRNDARYLKDGREVFVPGAELFGHRWPLKVADGHKFEAYPNRNSLPYIKLYGLAGVRTMLRGTLRNFGWCETLKAIADLGILKDETARTGLAKTTYAQWFAGYAEGRAGAARRLGLAEQHALLDRLAWLGLFDDRPIDIDQGTNLDILAGAMLKKMAYRPGERDMIVLHHAFAAEYPGRPARRIFSTLIDFGIPGGDSAMARTVSLPAAIAVRLILEGRVKLAGVQIPILPELYEPILTELARLGIECQEREEPAA